LEAKREKHEVLGKGIPVFVVNCEAGISFSYQWITWDLMVVNWFKSNYKIGIGDDPHDLLVFAKKFKQK